MTTLATTAPLPLLPVATGAWVCQRLELVGEDQLDVRFAAPEPEAAFDLTLARATPDRPATRGLQATVLHVRARLELAPAHRQQEASALLRGLAQRMDAQLMSHPDQTLAQALGRDTTTRTCRFSRSMLLEWLGPAWAPGTRLPGDWQMHDVFPASQLRQEATLTLAVELRHAAGRRLVLLVGQRGQKRVLAKTAHLDLEHLTLGVAPGPDGMALLTLLCFTLQLRDHAGLVLEFPEADEGLTALPAPTQAPADIDRAVNLGIAADCQQHCAFCSALDAMAPHDGGAAQLADLTRQLQEARAAGVGTVRYNGYDPLAFSRIVELMLRATDLGFLRVEIWSPATRLADPGFRRAVLASLPRQATCYVPVYGGTAEAHDAYVGRPGAFALIEAAVRGIQTDGHPQMAVLTSLLTRRNADQVLAIHQLATAWHAPLQWQMPFPTSESHDDRYHTEALSFAQAADVLVDVWAKHRIKPGVAGLPPCVLHARFRARGVRLTDWLDADRLRHHPATAYRSARFHHAADALGSDDTRVAPVIPCPHAATCALAVACPQAILRAHAERFGLDELAPVGLAELVG